MMFPTKMIYEPHICADNLEVTCYSFLPSCNQEGGLDNVYVVAWDAQNRVWITDELSKFIVEDKKILKE